jgi:RNA polymerase sigma-70 factor (ECF subfamily)
MKIAPAERFEELRPKLVRHAYRMLGQYGDAEDVVQDAYLRWSDALQKTAVADDQGFLRTTVTRLCLDRLRSARARREVYVGPWLPEPVVSDDLNDPQAQASLADDISFALLLALERLAPLERAAFLLHDVLDVPFEEVAQSLGRSEPAVRKLASRAREHVRDEKRRSGTDRKAADELRKSLMDALYNDDPLALEQLLTDDVIFTSDGGGKVPAAMVPVAGRERVSQLLRGLVKKGLRHIQRLEFVTLNAQPGIVTFDHEGHVRDAMALDIIDGRIAAFYVMRNPDKLRAVTSQLR